MANRIARSIGITPFHAEGQLPSGQLAIDRPAGEAGAAASDSFAGLAQKFGAMADQLAGDEGARAGNIAGNDPDFRPTGKLTIRGKEFDKSGIQTYLGNLDAQLRSDMQGVFEAHQDNPDGLRGAFDHLKAVYQEKHVFADIAGTFNSEFERLRVPYANQAQSNLRSAIKAKTYGDLITRLNDLDTTRTRQLASLDPSDPAAAGVLLSAQEAIDGQYDQAVANDLMTPAAAATAKIESRRGAGVDFYTRQAETMTDPADVAAFRAGVRERFAKGDLPGVDGEGFASLETSLANVESRVATSGTTAKNALDKQIGSYVDRVAAGLAPPADDWRRIELAAAATPDGQAMVDAARVKLRVADMIRTSPLPEATDAATALRKASLDDADPQTADVLAFAEKQLDAEKQRVGTDMLDAAARRRLIPAIAPLTIGEDADTGAIAGQVQARVAQADAVADQLGRRPQYLQPAEVAAIKQLTRTDVDAAVAVAGGIVKGGGAAPA